jgi:hypothetical protein
MSLYTQRVGEELESDIEHISRLLKRLSLEREDNAIGTLRSMRTFLLQAAGSAGELIGALEEARANKE